MKYMAETTKKDGFIQVKETFEFGGKHYEKVYQVTGAVVRATDYDFSDMLEDNGVKDETILNAVYDAVDEYISPDRFAQLAAIEQIP